MLNREVGFAPNDGHCQPVLSGPKSADIVAKVENRTIQKTSPKRIFRRLYPATRYSADAKSVVVFV
jgi:hypothetical protein